MIRLIRKVGRLKAGTETDFFDAAAEAAFISDGTAERVGMPCDGLGESGAGVSPDDSDSVSDGVRDYAHMKKDELLRIAVARGLEVSPRARVGDIVRALEESDANA